MTLATHVAIGGLIGTAVSNPILGFIFGFLSHLAVDVIPHGDSKLLVNYKNGQGKKTALAYTMIDAISAIYLILFIVNLPMITSMPALTWAIAGSVLPDLIVGVYEVTKSKSLEWFFRFHLFFHNFIYSRTKWDIKLRYSLMAQAGFIAISLNYLI